MTLTRVCISTCCCPTRDRSRSLETEGAMLYEWLPVLFLGPKLTPRSIKHKKFRFYQRTFSRLIDVCAMSKRISMCENLIRIFIQNLSRLVDMMRVDVHLGIKSLRLTLLVDSLPDGLLLRQS